MSALQVIYNRRLISGDAMAGHMDRVMRLARECETCVEFGIRRANSTVALLVGCPGRVYSYDVERLPQFHDPILDAAGNRWVPTYADTTTIDIPECDLLLHDSFHNYAVVKADLDRHADKVRKYLVFHDSITCGTVGEGIPGNHRSPLFQDTRGFRMAVDELMIRDPSWRIAAHYPDHNGLLVLQRCRS